DRVQSIDLQQKLLPRILGMAELVFDVAGGAGSNISLKYLSKKRAEELRDELLAAVRAKKQDTSGPAHTAPTTGTERIAEGAETPLAESARLASNAAATGSDASVPLGGPEDTVDRSVPERGDDSLGVRLSKRLGAMADDRSEEHTSELQSR